MDIYYLRLWEHYYCSHNIKQLIFMMLWIVAHVISTNTNYKVITTYDSNEWNYKTKRCYWVSAKPKQRDLWLEYLIVNGFQVGYSLLALIMRHNEHRSCIKFGKFFNVLYKCLNLNSYIVSLPHKIKNLNYTLFFSSTTYYRIVWNKKKQPIKY